MPDTKSRRPRVATCEEWDDETDTALPGSQTSANAANTHSEPGLIPKSFARGRQQDDSDSGYASKAGTVDSEPRNPITMNNFHEDGGIVERERQPYHVSQIGPELRRQPSNRQKEPREDGSNVRTRRTRHKDGTCTICDHYGEHLEPPKDRIRTSGDGPLTSSMKKPKETSGKPVKISSSTEPKPRGQSSAQQARPSSGHTPIVTQLPYSPVTPFYTTPIMVSPGWGIPQTPNIQFSTIPYTYTTPANMIPTIPATASYFDPNLRTETRQTRPHRRSESYDQQYRRSTSRQPLDRVSSNTDARPTVVTQKSNRDVRDGQNSMPLPSRPRQTSETTLQRRPSLRKSVTYATEPQTRRLDPEDEDYHNSKTVSGSKGRPSFPSRPPTSYRGPEGPQHTRNAESYSIPRTTNGVSTNDDPQTYLRRESTSSNRLEEQEAAAEEYQRKRNSMTRDLTAETLKEIKKHEKHRSQSETGSSHSHRSHQSSKDSSGRDRSHTSGVKTNITFDDGFKISIPAGRKGRPISVNMGNMTVLVKTEEDEDVGDKNTDQKWLGRTPSDASRASRQSIPGSAVSQEQERYRSHNGTRRPNSYVDDVRTKTKPGHHRKHSSIDDPRDR